MHCVCVMLRGEPSKGRLPQNLPSRSFLAPFCAIMASVFAGGMGDPSLVVFSPAECLVGGMFIGVSVVARAFALGTVTGISGIFGASVRFESLEKIAFSVGLFLSGVALFWGPLLVSCAYLTAFLFTALSWLQCWWLWEPTSVTDAPGQRFLMRHNPNPCIDSDCDTILHAVATASAASRASQPAPSLPFQHSCAGACMQAALACCHH